MTDRTGRTDPERHPGAWLARPAARRACAHCGEQFVPPVPSAKYCTTMCRTAAGLARRAERKRPKEGGQT